MTTISRESAGGPDTARSLLARMRAFNESHAGPLNDATVVLAARDEFDALVGGLCALRFWDALLVELLWVDPEQRRNGLGRSLLERAERVAGEEGLSLVYLSTFTFQAPGFYARCGYSEFGRLTDCPGGHARVWFVKRLSTPDGTA